MFLPPSSPAAKLLSLVCVVVVVVVFFFFFFFRWDPHVPLFPFLVCFSPETIYFVPVSILFILIEYSLNICHFSEFFLKSRFQVSL